MEDMRASHSLVGRSVTPQARSSTTQQQGEMRLGGSRVPHGGISADGYRPYAHHNAQNSYGVEALFAHARVRFSFLLEVLPANSSKQDADTMTETVRGFAPGIIKAIKDTVTGAGINPMGKMGMNSFYCWEYASPLHRDKDATWSLCCQLWKNTNHKDEYNFAYAEWGCYIVTQENCVWSVSFLPMHAFYLFSPGTSIRLTFMALYSLGNHLARQLFLEAPTPQCAR